MPTPISFATHKDKRWLRPRSYSHLKTTALISLTHTELPRAIMEMPVVFAKHKDELSLFAIMGTDPEKNLFVDSGGGWRVKYVPAVCRSRPFSLMRRQTGQFVLCVDEDSGLVTEDNGGPFFDEQGNLAERVQQTFNFLKRIERDRAYTKRACAVLHEYGMVEPWPNLSGLYRIKESQIKELSGEALVRLRDTGGLKIMYGQLYSMTQVGMLRKLAEEEKEPDIEQLFGDDDILSFDNI